MAKKSPGSLRREKRPERKRGATIVMTAEMKSELKRLSKMEDEEIKLDDIPEIKNWDRAVRGKFYRPMKKPITIRLDADVLAWFKAQSDKYQSKINTVLREYVRKHA